jgi:predicted GNAT family acetyltransferase
MGLSELCEGVWRTEKLIPTQDQYRHTGIGSQCCNELCLHLCGGIP